MKDAFKPNALTFKEGVERIKQANDEANFCFKSKISTSLDTAARKATGGLMVTNVPGGFKKFQLPLYLDKASQLFVSVGTPDTKVPIHSHDEGDGFRYISAGSIIYDGQELKAGDILFSIAGALGRVAIVAENVLPANTCCNQCSKC